MGLDLDLVEDISGLARFLIAGASEAPKDSPKVRFKFLLAGDFAGEEDRPEEGEEGAVTREREPYVFVTLDDIGMRKQ